MLELKDIQLSALSVNLMSTINQGQHSTSPRETINNFSSQRMDKNYIQRY